MQNVRYSPDYVPTIAGNPDDESLCLKCHETKASVLSPVHPVPWHIDVHDIPAECCSVKLMETKPSSLHIVGRHQHLCEQKNARKYLPMIKAKHIGCTAYAEGRMISSRRQSNTWKY